MSAIILDGKKEADLICEQLKSFIGKFKSKYNKTPSLLAILTLDKDGKADPASAIYVKKKKERAENLGINVEIKKIGSYDELEKCIKTANTDRNTHGILLQLPIMSNIIEKYIAYSLNNLTKEGIRSFKLFGNNPKDLRNWETAKDTPYGQQLVTIYSTEIIDMIAPAKDADRITSHLLLSLKSSTLMKKDPVTKEVYPSETKFMEIDHSLPCTPEACLFLIKQAIKERISSLPASNPEKKWGNIPKDIKDLDLSGLKAAVVGRSNLVGAPMAQVLLNYNATVSVLHIHSGEELLENECRTADILVVAAGKAGLITRDHVKRGAIVIDVGINRNKDGKLVGDVEYEEVVKRAGVITPVPGGVGPMTIAMLMKNIYNMAEAQEAASANTEKKN